MLTDAQAALGESSQPGKTTNNAHRAVVFPWRNSSRCRRQAQLSNKRKHPPKLQDGLL